MSLGIVPSASRPVPLRRRPGLECAPLGIGVTNGWAVKDPLKLEYHLLEEPQHAVWSRLDGRITMTQLCDALRRHDPTRHWTIPDLQRLLIDFHRLGLVVSERPGQSTTLQRRRDHKTRQQGLGFFRRLLFLKLPGWDPCRFLEGLLPYVRWIYHPLGIMVWILLVAAAGGLILVQFRAFRERLPAYDQFFGWTNLGYLWATLAVTKFWHELGHGLTCHYYGRRCHEIGVMLLVFTPTMYCDASDAWMLRDRWKRMAIGAGGMFFEAVLSALAVYVWWWARPGIVQHLAFNVLVVCSVGTTIFNLNPLMRYDGYFILADWLGIPNLRSKADRLFERWLATWFVGRDLPPDPLLPRTNVRWFVAYALASLIYGWLILASILMFLYSWLKPHQLQSLGIVLAVVSGVGVLGSMGVRAVRVARSPNHGASHWGRIAVSWGLLLAWLTGLLLIPIPWYLEGAVAVESSDSVVVENLVPGALAEIHVRPGMLVAAGAPMLELRNRELTDRIIALETERAAEQAVFAAALAREAQAERALSEDRLRGLDARLAAAREQVARLTIRAPIAGKVIAPDPRRPRPDSPERLAGWDGTPFEDRNLGAWLDPGTPLGSVAPVDQLMVIVYIPQAHREELRPDMPVRLKFDALPGRTFRGAFAELSQEHADIVPRSLSTKAGGPLATTTTPELEERLQELAYRGIVRVDDDEHVLRSGLRGSARIYVAHHTAWWWLRQTFRRTFQFRM